MMIYPNASSIGRQDYTESIDAIGRAMKALKEKKEATDVEWKNDGTWDLGPMKNPFYQLSKFQIQLRFFKINWNVHLNLSTSKVKLQNLGSREVFLSSFELGPFVFWQAWFRCTLQSAIWSKLALGKYVSIVVIHYLDLYANEAENVSAFFADCSIFFSWVTPLISLFMI